MLSGVSQYSESTESKIHNMHSYKNDILIEMISYLRPLRTQGGKIRKSLSNKVSAILVLFHFKFWDFNCYFYWFN